MCFLIISHLKVQISSTPLHTTVRALLHVFFLHSNSYCWWKLKTTIWLLHSNWEGLFLFFFFRDAACLTAYIAFVIIVVVIVVATSFRKYYWYCSYYSYAEFFLLLLFFVFTSCIIFKRVINEFVYHFIYLLMHAGMYVCM